MSKFKKMPSGVYVDISRIDSICQVARRTTSSEKSSVMYFLTGSDRLSEEHFSGEAEAERFVLSVIGG